MIKTKTKKIKKLPRASRFRGKKLIIALFVLPFVIFGIVTLLRTSAFVPSLKFNDGEYTALAPSRIHDGPIRQGETIYVQATNAGGVPASGVKAISANITVSGPTRAGFMTVYPSNAPRPNASSINFVASPGAIANDISVNVGADGRIAIYNAQGSARVIVDVNGFFSTEFGPDGSRFVPTNPERIFDQPVSTPTEYQVQVAGVGGVPASGVTAVVVNVTIDGPTSNSFISLYPTGTPVPSTSTINFMKGAGAVANQVTVKLGANGRINALNAAGTVRMILDVSGYYTTDGNRFVGITPIRLSDTGYGENQTKRVKIWGQKGVPPSHVKAVVLNVTAAGPTKPGFLTAYPSDTALPNVSSLNFTPASGAIANQIVAKVSADGYINIFNRYGNVRVVLDISGYYLNNDQVEILPYDAANVIPAGGNLSVRMIANDIYYGPNPSQHFDIYETANQPAAAAANRDTIVWFFGGGWEGGDNGLNTPYDNIAKHLAAQYGYKLVSVSYRKTPEAPYPAQYQDAIAVVKYLKANAASLDIDPNRIILGGFSAGGDLATMTGHGHNAAALQPTWLAPGVAAQPANVYRIISFATPFNKVSWAKAYFANASPLPGLNKLAGATGTPPNFPEYEKLNAMQYIDASDPPHFTVMSTTDEVIPFATQYNDIVQMGTRSRVVFQYGGPNRHVSGHDANVPALVEFLK